MSEEDCIKCNGHYCPGGTAEPAPSPASAPASEPGTPAPTWQGYGGQPGWSMGMKMCFKSVCTCGPTYQQDFCGEECRNTGDLSKQGPDFGAENTQFCPNNQKATLMGHQCHMSEEDCIKCNGHYCGMSD